MFKFFQTDWTDCRRRFWIVRDFWLAPRLVAFRFEIDLDINRFIA